MSIIDTLRPRPGLKVLVTAGASGIGAAIARGFLEAGARVLICDIDGSALAKAGEAMPGVLTAHADVGDDSDVARLLAQAHSEFGGLDVLVNNAGVAGPTGTIDTLAPADIRRTLDINLTGQFLTVHHAAPLLRASGNGTIINVSSVAGRLGYALRTPYAASKWAITGLTQSLAKELGPDGIRVNAILPGIVRGPRMSAVIRARAEAEGLTEDEMEAQYLSAISLRRMVEPEDVAAMALFLCSPGGGNISGQSISVCGNVETI